MSNIHPSTEVLQKENLMLKKENTELLSRIQTIKGNILVYIRIKPEEIEEQTSSSSSQKYLEVLSNNVLGYYDHYSNTWKSYTFDHIFQPYDSQETVFSEYEHCANSILEGYNICILAYGQTGSGKTYTMIGNKSNWGINFRIINKIFTISESKGIDLTMNLSMYEIYNEEIIDLLNPHNSSGSGNNNSNNSKTVKLNVVTTENGTAIQGLTSYEVRDQNDILKYFSIGNENRSTASTNIHEHSSRSHCIMTIEISYTDINSKIINGKMSLVDLAGSENIQKSGVKGNRLVETQNINKSLSCLGEVINALDNKSKHIPYRNSKLTFSLKDALSPGSKTIMICTIRTLEDTWNETQSTLNFASRARNISLGSTKQMVEYKNMKEENTKLKKYIVTLEDQIQQYQSKVEQINREKENALRLVQNDMNKRKRKNENEISQLQRDIESCKIKINDLITMNESLKNEKNLLQNDLSNTKQKLNTIDQKYQSLLLDYEDLNIKNQETDLLVNKLKKTISLTSSSNSNNNLNNGLSSSQKFSNTSRMQSRILKPSSSSTNISNEINNSNNNNHSTPLSRRSSNVSNQSVPNNLSNRSENNNSSVNIRDDQSEPDLFIKMKKPMNSKHLSTGMLPPSNQSVNKIFRSQTTTNMVVGHKKSVSFDENNNERKLSDDYYFNWLKTLPPTNTLTKCLDNYRPRSSSTVSNRRNRLFDIESERTVNLKDVDNIINKLNSIISSE